MSATAHVNCSGSSVAGPSSSSVGSLALSSPTTTLAASTPLEPGESSRSSFPNSLMSVARFCAGAPYLATDWISSTVCADEEIHLQSRKRKRVSWDEWIPTARTKRSRIHRSQHDQLQLNVLRKLLVAFHQSDALSARAGRLALDVRAASDAARAFARKFVDAEAQRARTAGDLRMLEDAHAQIARASQGIDKLQQDVHQAIERNTDASNAWAITNQHQITRMRDLCKRSVETLQKAGCRTILRSAVQTWVNVARSAAEQHNEVIQRGREMTRGFEEMADRANELSCKQEESVLDLIILWKASTQAA